VRDLAAVDGVLKDAIGRRGPTLVEVDMVAVGPFASAFAGPPVKTKAPA
jgi:acetolactate synthase I/II/III large subunit